MTNSFIFHILSDPLVMTVPGAAAEISGLSEAKRSVTD